METEILKLIGTVGPWGAIAISAYFARPVWGALADKIRGKNGSYVQSSTESDKRIKELEEFKEDAEQNHFHDLSDMKNEMSKLRDKVDDIHGRVIRVETHLWNGVKNKQ